MVIAAQSFLLMKLKNECSDSIGWESMESIQM